MGQTDNSNTRKSNKLAEQEEIKMRFDHIVSVYFNFETECTVYNEEWGRHYSTL